MNVGTVPANASLLRYFKNRASQYDDANQAEIHGTHPDLVERLWDQLGKLLPEDCHAVVYGTPVLVRPATGIIFSFAGGTHTYAFRLPPELREPAIKAGAKTVYHYRAYPELNIEAYTFDLADIGDEWVFCGWLKGEEEWMRVAYAFAARPNI